MHGGKGKNSKFYKLVISIALIYVIFCFAPKIFANEGHVVINEIYPAPFENEKEWVELYNPTDEAINLDNCILKDGAVSAKKLNGIIKPNDYYLFESNSGWLNNSSEILFLIDSNTNTLIDKVAYGDWETKVIELNNDIDPDDNAINPGSGQSISRIPNASDTDSDINDFRITATTKNAENYVIKYSDAVKINEIFPQPADGSDNEFIELFNTGLDEINLSNWQIDDAEGGSSPYSIPNGTIINAKCYIVFYHKNTSISLNDNGDTVRLIDPNNEIKDIIAYNKSERNKSHSVFEDKWLWTLKNTPGEQNIYQEEQEKLDEETEIITIDIKIAKEKEVDEVVKIEGVVTAVPSVLSDQYFYIQDESAGIQIYNSKGIFPELKIGQNITVIGEIASAYGEKRIKINSVSDVVILDVIKGINPLEKSIVDFTEDDVGRYVKTTGEVQQTSGDTFVINDNKSIKIIIKDGTSISKPKMRKGDKVRIEGILSIYKSEYRILPIYQDGVTILTSGMLPVTGDESGEDRMKKIITKNLEDTCEAANYIVNRIEGGDILLLDGDLGSGKTTLAKYIGKKLGVKEEITSPTYVIMKNYLITPKNGISEIAHIDAYRIGKDSDAENIGLSEYIGKDNTLVIVEWPKNITNSLPSGCKKVDLRYLDENSREVIINF